MLSHTLQIKYPLIMAPMFLVTSPQMVEESVKAGIAGCLPAHNFAQVDQLAQALKRLRQSCPQGLGINLIVNASNPRYQEQLACCIDHDIDFFITSLGNPQEVIKRSKQRGIKVFCDVTDLQYAQKVAHLGADALIAVNSGAGGHAGKIPATILVPMLKRASRLPVISAGGVATGEGMLSIFSLGADGISIGSPFISTRECQVSDDYKRACINYGAADVVLSDKISGVPCTVINTPYVQKIGTRQNALEAFLNSHPRWKKYSKILTWQRGMKALQRAAFSATYKTVWCAGPSIEFTHGQPSVEDLVVRLVSEYQEARANLMQNNALEF